MTNRMFEKRNVFLNYHARLKDTGEKGSQYRLISFPSVKAVWIHLSLSLVLYKIVAKGPVDRTCRAINGRRPETSFDCICFIPVRLFMFRCIHLLIRCHFESSFLSIYSRLLFNSNPISWGFSARIFTLLWNRMILLENGGGGGGGGNWDQYQLKYYQENGQSTQGKDTIYGHSLVLVGSRNSDYFVGLWPGLASTLNNTTVLHKR